MSKYSSYPVTRLFASSTFTEPRPKHRLTVDTGSSLGEIFVIDADFNMVARGQGHLDVELPEAAYLLKYRNGDRYQEQWVTLSTDVHKYPNEAPIPPTVAPIAERAGWPSVDSMFAEDLRHRHRLSIVVRDENGTPPIDDVQILDANGERIVRMADATAVGWELGSSLQTVGMGGDPGEGCCLLRVFTPGLRPYMMALWVAPGCSTQVFMERRSLGVRGARRKGPQMTSASVFVADQTIPWGPFKELLAMVESAKSVLSYDRPIIPAEHEIRSALESKFRCPLLGLLFGHLLRLSHEQADDKRKSLLIEVVRNMEFLMPGSPDVGALALSLGMRTNADFRVPPMLAHSWAILTSLEKSPIPKRSYAERIRPAALTTRPWLLWNQSLMGKRTTV